MTRLATIVAILMTTSVVATPAQSPQCVTLRIEFQSDDPDEGTRTISTAEGRATAAVQLGSGDTHRDFYLDLMILDRVSGFVLVSIRNDRNSDRIADEFELQVDGPSLQAATAPPFRLSVLRIFERTGFSCAF
jgi:hypothetical protein